MSSAQATDLLSSADCTAAEHCQCHSSEMLFWPSNDVEYVQLNAHFTYAVIYGLHCWS